MNSPRQTSSVLVLDAVCTVAGAGAMRRRLLEFPAGPVVRMDGSRVESIDTAGLQLLVSFTNLQRAAGRLVQWAGASDVLRRHSEQLGLSAVLGLAPAAVTGSAA